MLKWMQVEIPLGGLDQYTDAPHVLPGKLLHLQNARFRNPPAIVKRNGFEVLSTTDMNSVSLAGLTRVLGHHRELLVADTDTLYSYSQGKDTWASRGYLSPCHVKRIPRYGEFSAAVSNATVAANGSFICYAWQGTGARNCCMITDALDDSVLNVQALTYNAAPKIIRISTSFYLFLEPTGSGLKRHEFDTTAKPYQFGSASNVNTTSPANISVAAFDVCTDLTNYWIAYVDNVSGDVYVDRFNPATHAVTHTLSIEATGLTVYAIAIFIPTGSSYIWIATADSTNGLRVTTALKADLTSASTTVIDASVTGSSRCSMATIDSTHVLLAWDVPSSGDRRQHIKYQSITTAPAGGTAGFAYDQVIAGQPFLNSDNIIYLLTSFGTVETRTSASTSPQETFYLLAVHDGSDVLVTPYWSATAARGIAMPPTRNGYVGQVTGYPGLNGEWTGTMYAALTKSRINYAKDDDGVLLFPRGAVDGLVFDFATDHLHASAPWGRGRFFAGGRPSWYDGSNVTEHSFAWTPEYRSSIFSAGGVLTTGTYYLTQTYEHEDANHYIIRSAPSPVFTMSETTGLGKGIVITQLQDITLTHRPSTALAATRVYTYRTLVNGTEPLYRGHTDIYGGPSEFQASDTIGGTETDAMVAFYDVLYTTGGILDNAGTPPCKYVVYHRERLWIAGMEDPTWVWFSQPFVEGEQPRFNEALRINVGAEVTALASIDTALIVFSETAVYAIHGEGPPATGGIELGLSLTEVTRDVGCIDWRSVTVTPQGAMFLSHKGVYLLGRDLSVAWVGAQVQSYVDDYPTPVGATVQLATSEAELLYQNSSGNNAALVYNYALGNWSVDIFPTVESLLSQAITYDPSDGLWKLTRCSSTRVKRETPAAYNESALAFLHIPLLMSTPWISLNTIQGWQRVRKILVLLDPAYTVAVQLSVVIYHDYASASTETHAFSAAEIAALGSYQVEVHCGKQQCQAIRIEVYDDDLGDETLSAGPAIRSIVLEAGISSPRGAELDASKARD